MKASKAIYFLGRTFNDIVKPNRFGVHSDFKYNGTHFPTAFKYTTKGMEDVYDMTFDENGIIMMPHHIDYKGNESYYHSPVKVAHYALGAYNDYLDSKDEKYLKIFWNYIHFLTTHKEYFKGQKDAVVWNTPSAIPKYDITLDYFSAIVQGIVISALVRAYVFRFEDEYLDMALKATRILQIPVEEGGLLASSEWGISYEEYPCLPYSHVVNGFIFCLIGLNDLYMVSKDSSIGDMLQAGAKTLAKMLEVWILPYWSKYDLADITRGTTINLATRHYQYIHIDQLNIMWLITGDTIFKTYRDLLTRQIKNPITQMKVYKNKFETLILNK